MLTPEFELDQNDDFLIIYIKVPYAKVSETDIFFEDFDFKFYCKPYFLRLNLPGKVLYCEVPKVSYDISCSKFTIHLPKSTKGESFEDLCFLTKLLAPKSQAHKIPKIEVIGETNFDDFEDFDWNIEQAIPENDSLLFKEMKCGFGNSYSSAVFRLKEESSVIFDVVDHYRNSPSDCTREKLVKENNDFSEDHYLADLYEDSEILNLISYEPEWNALFCKNSQCGKENFEDGVQFTMEEKDILRRLPNKEFLLDRGDLRSIHLGLIDIIFAYAYNKRVTEGENTVESAWNINKLSSTLSWLEVFPSVKAVVKSCVQRSLIYPLFRHWDLALAVLEDTKNILRLGRKCILKCLLEIHTLFSASEPRYILNELFITDYCVWIQCKSCRSTTFWKLADAIGKVQIQKENLDLDLFELEYAAEITLEESELSARSPSKEIDSICSNMFDLSVKQSEDTKSNVPNSASKMNNSRTDEPPDSDDVDVAQCEYNCISLTEGS